MDFIMAAGQTLLQQENGTVCLGQVQAGQTITVELRPQDDTLSLGGWSFAVEDSQALATACTRLQQQGLQVAEFAPGLVRGTIRVPEGCTALFTSIPAEPGWQVLVDGETVAPETAWDALLTVQITPGEHLVTLRFTPAGLGLGTAVSLCSLGAAAAWLALDALARGKRADGVTAVTAGDFTVRRTAAAAGGEGLRKLARRLMAPYLRDGEFCFRGVPG